jgi:protein-S-isoprenylcysteine O-methyltransferase Ste14
MLEWSDALVIAAVIAIINRIKSEAPEIKGYWYTIIAFVLGGLLYVAGLYLPEVAKVAILIGLSSSGVYDAYKKQ